MMCKMVILVIMLVVQLMENTSKQINIQRISLLKPVGFFSIQSIFFIIVLKLTPIVMPTM